jgi:thiamine transport system ATP-binding protein
MLRVEDVTVRFGETVAVDHVTFEIATGEVLAALGPSGSGKSTLLRVISGLQRPDRGRVLLDGEDITSAPPHRRGIGLVFQDHALFHHKDVAGNVGFGLRSEETRRR